MIRDDIKAALITSMKAGDKQRTGTIRLIQSAVKNRDKKGGDIMASFAVVTNINSSSISAIRNLICPLCGASMMEFRCLGYCRSDWRQEWKRAMCAGSKSEGPRSGKSCAKHRL